MRRLPWNRIVLGFAFALGGAAVIGNHFIAGATMVVIAGCLAISLMAGPDQRGGD